jgi:hypothetical protein
MGNNRLHDKTLKPKTDKNNLTGINKEVADTGLHLQSVSAYKQKIDHNRSIEINPLWHPLTTTDWSFTSNNSGKHGVGLS